jgi:hypothetical protein
MSCGPSRPCSSVIALSRKCGHSSNSRPTPWCWSPRRHCIMGSIPAARASGIRWWFTSMPRYWPMRTRPVSPSSKAAHAFLQKRPSASRAMPVGWRWATTPTASSWRSAPGLARSRQRCGAHSPSGTRVAASPAVIYRSARLITSSTGPTVAPLRCPIWFCCVVGTIELFTKKAFRSDEATMAGSSSTGLTAARYGRCHRLRQCPAIRRLKFGRGMPRPVSAFSRTRPRRAGMADGWTSVGRSTCYIRGLIRSDFDVNSTSRRKPVVLSTARRRSSGSPRDPSAEADARGTAPCARASAPGLAPAHPSSSWVPAPG